MSERVGGLVGIAGTGSPALLAGGAKAMMGELVVCFQVTETVFGLSTITCMYQLQPNRLV